MKKYVASSPDALILGSALKAYETSKDYAMFQDILRSYGLETIDAETWYPQQLTLDIQRAIKETDGGYMKLVSIGKEIIDTAAFPPMNSLEDAINAFASSYPLNFRNQAPHDLITADMVAPGHIRVINCSPHSDDMIYGYVFALIQRFAPENAHPVVQFEDYTLCDSDGDTVFDVRW